jgi:hypothetical protein
MSGFFLISRHNGIYLRHRSRQIGHSTIHSLRRRILRHSNFAHVIAPRAQFNRLLAAIAVGGLLAQPVMAQLSIIKPTVDSEAATLTAGGELNPSIASIANTAPSALRAVDQNRVSIIETIVNQWKGELAGTGSKEQDTLVNELRSSLSALRADNLLAASTTRTLDGLKLLFAFSDEQAKASGALGKGDHQKTLGSFTNDLVYTPITPCKLVDTRTPGTGYSYAAGGAFAASQKRTYDSYTFCGPIPANTAAIQVSVNTQYGGAGGGILSLMANAAAAPVTNIFYAGYAPVTTVVPVNGPGNGGLFDAQISGVAGADLIIDVVGYYAAPVATALQCQYTTGPALSVAAGLYQTMGTVACPTGYTAVSQSFQASSNVVLADNYPVGTGWFMAVKNVGGVAVTVTPAAQCCRIPGR